MAERPPVGTGTRTRSRAPMPPQLPTSLEPAAIGEHDLEDEATFQRVSFEVGLPGRSAGSVEFGQCGFPGADLSGTTLIRARFSDCVLERANLANLRVERSSMLRVRISEARMTGLHWVDGTLRDLLVSRCRADLSVFRFTEFRRVRFEDCNLAGADFQNARLGGAEFVDCDLTGAQFSHATMEGARFRRCVLDGIGGVTSFNGAIITGHDLIALSYTLAAGLGIQVDDGEDAP